MRPAATLITPEIEIPDAIAAELESAARMVTNGADKPAMLEVGAIATFRAAAASNVTPDDFHLWQPIVESLREIATGARIREKATDRILEKALALAEWPPEADELEPQNRPQSPAIITTESDLRKFFADWRAAIADSPYPEETWKRCAREAAAKYHTQQISKQAAVDELDRIACNLDLFADGRTEDDRTALITRHIGDAFTTADTKPPPFDRMNALFNRSTETRRQIATAAAETAHRDKPPKPVLLSKADFLAQYIPPDWLIDGILQRRFVYSLTGKTGHGKTAVALLIAQAVAGNHKTAASIGHHAVDSGNVIYFAGENPDDLRARMIASDYLSGRDCSADRIHVIPGTFSIEVMHAECATKISSLPGGKIDLIIVDTSAAYFLGDDENNNPQMGTHARVIRNLVTLPGGPCGLVLCHPTKNASEQADLLPRGGGAFIAEVDGNLTAWKADQTTELWHTGKLRGPGFEPITFRLETVTCPALVDSKGRPCPTVRASVITDTDKDDLASVARSNEDAILVAILEKPRSQRALAEACSWTTPTGEPLTSRVNRTLATLQGLGLVTKGRGGIYELTEGKGKKAAEAAAKQTTATA
jgi:hypothetical protein